MNKEFHRRRLGIFLRAARMKAGLTQQQVAGALGYSTPQFISNWERGVSRPPDEVLARLRNMYGVSFREFREAFIAYEDALHKDRIKMLAEAI